jgi:ectoine hydroxylase-related dioxygenase (phytanoyl-CoA dioxygenase family)
VVPTGTDGAAFSWTESPTEVNRALRDTDAHTVRFMPGDAIFFDEITLHSTATSPHMTQRRVAIEAWMFGARKPAYDRLALLL